MKIGFIKKLTVAALAVVLISSCANESSDSSQAAESQFQTQLNAAYRFSDYLTDTYESERAKWEFQGVQDLLPSELSILTNEIGENKAPKGLSRIFPNYIFKDNVPWLNSYEFQVDDDFVCVVPQILEANYLQPFSYELLFDDCRANSVRESVQKSLDLVIDEIVKQYGYEKSDLYMFILELLQEEGAVTNMTLNPTSDLNIKAQYEIEGVAMSRDLLLSETASLTFSSFSSPLATYCYVLRGDGFQFSFADSGYGIHEVSAGNPCKQVSND